MEATAADWSAEGVFAEPGAPRGARAEAAGCGAERRPYVPRQPENTVLHRVVREHLETFLAEARLRGGGEGLPPFVERVAHEILREGQGLLEGPIPGDYVHLPVYTDYPLRNGPIDVLPLQQFLLHLARGEVLG